MVMFRFVRFSLVSLLLFLNFINVFGFLHYRVDFCFRFFPGPSFSWPGLRFFFRFSLSLDFGFFRGNGLGFGVRFRFAARSWFAVLFWFAVLSWFAVLFYRGSGCGFIGFLVFPGLFFFIFRGGRLCPWFTGATSGLFFCIGFVSGRSLGGSARFGLNIQNLVYQFIFSIGFNFFDLQCISNSMEFFHRLAAKLNNVVHLKYVKYWVKA